MAHRARSTFVLSFGLVFSFCFLVSLCAAPSAAAPPRDPGNIAMGVGGDNLDGLTGLVALRWISDGGDWLGLRLSGGWLRERFVGGYTVDEGASLSAAVQGSWLLTSWGPARMRFATDLGTRLIVAREDTPAGDRSTAMTLDLAPTVEVDVASDLTVLATVHTGFALAVDPEVEVDTLENPLELGLRWWMTPQWALKTAIYVGSAFGYGGDGPKHRLGGTVGLEYAFAAREAVSSDGDKRPSVGAFVGFEWRMLALAGHVSHGPGFSAGATFFDGWLKVGLAGFGRPGPLNSETFRVESSNGAAYKGSTTLDLKSDGSLVGLLVGASIPVVDWLRIEVPVIVGQAGFGFYLDGDDRKTPDGRRVSAWENELQDRRDASIGFGADFGLRAVFTPNAMPWLRPLVGVHYTVLPGYDAYVTDDYDGLSVVLGTEIGVF